MSLCPALLRALTCPSFLLPTKDLATPFLPIMVTISILTRFHSIPVHMNRDWGNLTRRWSICFEFRTRNTLKITSLPLRALISIDFADSIAMYIPSITYTYTMYFNATLDISRRFKGNVENLETSRFRISARRVFLVNLREIRNLARLLREVLAAICVQAAVSHEVYHQRRR